MGTSLLTQVIKAMVVAMVSMLSPLTVRQILDKAFDGVEAKVIASPNKWDDAIAIPVLKAIRVALNVPDNDEAGGIEIPTPAETVL